MTQLKLILLPVIFLTGGALAGTPPVKSSIKSSLNNSMSMLRSAWLDAHGTKTENAAALKAVSSKISKAAHQIKKSLREADAPFDPSMALFAKLLGDQARLAEAHIQRGNLIYGRAVIQSVLSTCIGCHTRTEFEDAGAKSKKPGQMAMLAAETAKIKDPLLRAEFLTATRQVDLAVSAYEKIFSTPSTFEGMDTGLLAWERGLRNQLILNVRVSPNPDRALGILEMATKNTALPSFLKEDIQSWKESIQTWKAEFNRTPDSEEGYFAEAIRLFAKARSLQKYPSDRSADVYFLRASARLHELLEKFPKSTSRAKAYDMLGMTYDALRDLRVDGLHDLYYELCIYEEPHSEIAMKCYSKLEGSIVRSFTGSAGTSMPQDIRDKLKDLQKLSRDKNWH